ncbi:MAG: glycosyl transferase [Muribaculaceae bacterium]|nr:glycosyl transferase [Muribaculaceae bacterium]
MKKDIPKIIHYCWFGGNPLPSKAKKCIESWKEYFPEYEIKEWNESNFDFKSVPYARDAYESRKFAFVSDYARFWILYNFGGIYFDTDVKVIKSFDDILARGPFMGRELTIEEADRIGTIGVNAGLGLGCYSHHPFYKEMVELYNSLDFKNKDNESQPKTVVEYVSEKLMEVGLKNTGAIQIIEDIYIYPSDYFCPISPVDMKMRKTGNTHSIHEFSASWIPPKRRKILRFGKKYPRIMRVLLVIKHFFDGTRPL